MENLLNIAIALITGYISTTFAPVINEVFSKNSNYLAKRFKKRKHQKILKEYEIVKYYANNRRLLVEYMAVYIVKSIILLCILLVFNLFLDYLKFTPTWDKIFSASTYAFNLFVLILIIKLGNDTLDIYVNVKNFEKYEESVLALLDQKPL